MTETFRDQIHLKLKQKHSETENKLKTQLEDISKWQFTSKHNCASFVVSRLNGENVGVWKDAARNLGFYCKIRKSTAEDAGAGARDLIIFDKPPKDTKVIASSESFADSEAVEEPKEVKFEEPPKQESVSEVKQE